MSLSSLTPRVKRYVRDKGGVLADPDDYDLHLRDAVLRYSRRRPRRLVIDIAGTGGHDYPLPAEWDEGFSAIEQVEYPVGRRPAALLARREWGLYHAPEGAVLRFRDASPAEGETIRLTITAPHRIEDASTTIPVADHDTIVNLAVGLACEAIASEYSNDQDALLGADVVNHKTKAGEFALRAKRYLALAQSELPELGEEVRAAGGETSFAGEIGFLTHDG